MCIITHGENEWAFYVQTRYTHSQTHALCRSARDGNQPADERGDDHTPGGAAAIGVGRILALPSATTQPERVKEEEEEVQCQTHQRHCT